MSAYAGGADNKVGERWTCTALACVLDLGRVGSGRRPGEREADDGGGVATNPACAALDSDAGVACCSAPGPNSGPRAVAIKASV